MWRTLEVSAAGCHSLFRPEQLTQYRTVFRTICKSGCLHFPALTWILRFSTRLNAPSCSPETEPKNTLSVSFPLSGLLVPLYFRNCSHMSEAGGTPGSNAHLEKQHYYLQLTLNFKCIKRGRNRSGRGKVEGEMARLKRETDEVKRGDLSMCARICPPAVVQIPELIDCLPRIICPRHFKEPPLLLLFLLSASHPLHIPLFSVSPFSPLSTFPALCSPSCRNLPFLSEHPETSWPPLGTFPTSLMISFPPLDTLLY